MGGGGGGGDGGIVITIDANGGTVTPGSDSTGEGGKLTSLPTPTRTDHTFVGWFTATIGGTAVTTSTVFNEEAVIHARWTYNGTDNTITFNANGGTVDPVTAETDVGWKLQNLPVPRRTGYTFAG